MSKLFIHIGHAKTGSTALQNYLANNEKFLAENSVIYPVTSGLRAAASKGAIVTGNGRNILEYLSSIRNLNSQNLLFSSEMLLFDVSGSDFRKSLFAEAQRLGLEVEFVCYTRDFFAFSFSSWGQYIKRDKGIRSWAEFMLSENTSYSLNGELFVILKNFLEFAAMEGYNVKIFNYERHKENIQEHFLTEVLKINYLPTLDARKRNNRSLTISEYELQRLFNKFYPENSSKFISDQLVQGAPEIQSEIPDFSRIEYDAVVERYRDDVYGVNKFVDEKENILIEDYGDLKSRVTHTNRDVFTFNAQQLEILTKSIVERLDNPENFSAKKLIKHRVKQKLKRFIKNFFFRVRTH